MPYSLVSAATLGFDLVRLPAGPLGRLPSCSPACRADATTLAAVAAVHPGRGLAPRSSEACSPSAPARARELAAAVPHMRSAACRGATALAVLVAQLERGTIGDASHPRTAAPGTTSLGPRAPGSAGFLSDDEWDEAARRAGRRRHRATGRPACCPRSCGAS